MLKNSVQWDGVQWDGWYDGKCVVVDDQHKDQQEEANKSNVEHFNFILSIVKYSICNSVIFCKCETPTTLHPY